MFPKKIKILYFEYANTTVVDGSSLVFFFCFWLTKLFSLLQHMHPAIDNAIHKLVSRLPHPQFVIKNPNGTFAVQAFDDSTTICSSYFEAELRPWLDRPAGKNIFVDIGANRGIYTLLASGQHGFSAVHAFEPNAEMFAVLQKNIALNDRSDSVSLHQAAVGREKATLTLSVDPMHKGGGKITSEVSQNEVMMEIELVPLDSILTPAEYAQVDFIKIDTEGYEQEVLSGMPQTLLGMPTGSCLMIETTQLETIETLLQSYQFVRVESSNEDHLFIKQHKEARSV